MIIDGTDDAQELRDLGLRERSSDRLDTSAARFRQASTGWSIMLADLWRLACGGGAVGS